MAIRCGDWIWNARGTEIGTIGCVVQRDDNSSRLYLLAAQHVVCFAENRTGSLVRAASRQAGEPKDPVTNGQAVGTVAFVPPGNTATHDMALVRLDAGTVAADVDRIGILAGFGNVPPQDAPLTIAGAVSGLATTRVRVPSATVTLDWPDPPGTQRTFDGQILCDFVTQHGDSGGPALDAAGDVVGFVLGEATHAGTTYTAISPAIAVIRDAALTGGGENGSLVLIGEIDPPAAPPPPAGDERLNAAITAALKQHEIGSRTAYELSFAQKGRSGGSFGAMQGDLATGGDDVKETFREALTGSFDANTISHYISELSQHCWACPPDIDIDRVDAALRSDNGKRLVDAMDTRLRQTVDSYLTLCRNAAQEGNHTIADDALICMALWTNMSGKPTVLLDWLRGKRITQWARVVEPPAAGEVSRREIENYLLATPYFVQNSGNFAHFTESVDKGMKILRP